MPGDYSEELVELVARKLADIYSAPLDKLSPKGRAMVEDDARALLDALSSAGRLVPEGSEVREEWLGIVEMAEPLYRVTRQGPFHYTAYIATHSFHAGRPLSLFVGTTWTRQRAERMAKEELARRTKPTPWTPAEPAQEER